MRTSALKLVCEADGLEIDLAPLQGLWTEEQYLRLTDQTNRFIEFTEGSVEVLPMPTHKHHAISRFLFLAFLACVQHIGGLCPTRRYGCVSGHAAFASQT